MTTLNKEVLSTDLDFLIGETGKDFIGVSPASILDKVFFASLTLIDEGYEVMLNGNEVVLDGHLLINAKSYTVLPTKGAVLKDRDGTRYKIMDVQVDDYGPAQRLTFVSQYARE